MHHAVEIDEPLGPELARVVYWQTINPLTKPGYRKNKQEETKKLAKYFGKFSLQTRGLARDIALRRIQAGTWSTEMAYSVSVSFYLPLHKNGKLEGLVKRADADNLLKSLLDCLNGTFWVDDCQVFHVGSVKRSTEEYSPVGKPGMLVSIRAFEPMEWM